MDDKKPTHGNWRWQVIEYLLFWMLFLVVCLWGLDKVPFNQDESSWISSSNSFEAIVRLDFKSPVWDESYWTLTQPPMARYLVGLGRSLGGYDDRHLNVPWDFFQPDETNIQMGAMPQAGLLFWSRLPMAVITSLSLFMLFSMLRSSGGRFAAVCLVGMMVFNPYLLTSLRLALGEAALTFFTCSAILLGYLGVRAWNRRPSNSPTGIIKPSLFFLGMAAACGLAGASKLNGLSALVGGVFLVQWLGFRQKERSVKPWLVLVVPLVMVGVALLCFILVNPFLYANPILNSIKMVLFRTYEMKIQQSLFPESRITGFWQHISLPVLRVFQDFSTIRFKGAWLLNIPLLVTGMIVVTRRIMQNRQAADPILALVLVGTLVSVPALFTPLDYPRYFLFPVLFSLVLIAVGIQAIIQWILERFRKSRNSSAVKPKTISS